MQESLRNTQLPTPGAESLTRPAQGLLRHFANVFEERAAARLMQEREEARGTPPSRAHARPPYYLCL